MGLDHELTTSDWHSITWERLRVALHKRLAQLREENDSGDAELTAKRRGRIAEIKDMLALEFEAPQESVDR